MHNDLAPIFTDASARRMDLYLKKIRGSIALLNEEQLWARGSENENSAGNLLLHLAGNVRQWILGGVGGQPDNRKRDTEFAARGNIDASELMRRLESTVTEACQVIRSQDAAGLLQAKTIQGYQITALEAILHVVEHFAHHAGQIIFITKLATRQDLGFYKHLGYPHSEKTP